MPLLKDGQAVDDIWVTVDDDEDLPARGCLLLSADRLMADRERVSTNDDVFWGVAWPNDRPVTELRPMLERLSLICLSFPTFKDGRAYTQARLLREQYGYQGELRATGHVLRDQFAFMVRSGFDALQVSRAADAAAYESAVAAIPVVYQPGTDNRIAALRARVQTR